jgi:hypothetical protein
MRVFHWTSIPTRSIAGTLWEKFAAASATFDTEAFEASFQAKRPARSAQGGSARTEDKKSNVVELLDGKRSNNVNIALAGFRMSAEDIRDRLLRMDESITMSDEKLLKLLAIVPTAEEVDMMQAYDGGIENLGKAEQFFLTISTIPHLQERLRSCMFRSKFDANVFDIETGMEHHELALQTIKSSAHLKKVMLLVLSLGNYLNAGTPKGAAYGFQLSTLGKLPATKSADNKTTLLMFAVQELKRTSEDTLDFADEFITVCQPGARVETDWLSSSVEKCDGAVNSLEQLLHSFKDDDGEDQFSNIMSGFLDSARSRTKALSYRMDALKQQGADLCTYFGEDSQKLKTEAVLKIFADFAKATKANMLLLAAADARALKDALKAKQGPSPTRRHTLAPGSTSSPPRLERTSSLKDGMHMTGVVEGNVVDSVMGSVRKADAHLIAAEIRRRRENKSRQVQS